MFRERKSSVRGVLPEGQYNPVVGEGVRWLDYERAAEDVPGDTPATTEFPSSREGSAPLAPCPFRAGHSPAEGPTPPPGLPEPPPSHPAPAPATGTPSTSDAASARGVTPAWEPASPGDLTSTSDEAVVSDLTTASDMGSAPGVASALDVLTGLATRPGPPPGPSRTETPYGLTFSLDALNRLAARPKAHPGPANGLTPDLDGLTALSGAEAITPQAPADVPTIGDAGTSVEVRGDRRPGADAREAGPGGDAATGAGPHRGEPGAATPRGFGAAVSGMRRLDLGSSDRLAGSGGTGRTGDGRHPLEVRIDRARNKAGADWFEGERRPPRLVESRPYGLPGGLAQPDPQVERDLRQALESGARFPDPRGTWVRLINGGGPADDPFRASNAADCALAVLSTWHGEPATAAPRLPEYDRIGRPLLTGEQGGAARIERWTGQKFQYAGQGRHAYPMVARRLLEAGHGAGAVIAVRWPGGGSHVWNAVNSGSEVIWIDAQRGHMSVEPPYATVTGVFCMILDRQGRPR
ncbi:toxin glutamine deamidase domain-containing protein [Nonomuraea sp. NPDC051191]|uniref:toxin glutamine deamidase domain-containing protein n=1 Tax=Nonomuraea sp. NPDC051191 TaxID=3364372 RepID=UPI00379F7337